MAQENQVDNRAARDLHKDVLNDNLPIKCSVAASNEEGPESSSGPDCDKIPECAVCLQTCIHPVRLPCSHIFCFLCVKGVANQSKRCALCRQEIPVDFLNNPTLLRYEDLLKDTRFDDDHQWYYEGRNGWWQYDERTSQELEERYVKGTKAFEILIAGFLYVVDMENMIQFRRNDPTRRRRIKRDLYTIPKKGVAGLKIMVTEFSDSDDPSSTRHGADGGETDELDNVDSGLQSGTMSSDSTTPPVPSNTPQSPEDGSPGQPSSPTPDDIANHMANLSLNITGRHRSITQPHRQMDARHSGLFDRPNRPRIRLLDTPSSSSDSDWD